jgi:hypothetical protein
MKGAAYADKAFPVRSLNFSFEQDEDKGGLIAKS